jgi:hypothetical protein
MIEINVGYPLTEKQLNWLEKNVSGRFYYLHTQTGGNGWTFLNKRVNGKEQFTLIFDDEKSATYFVLSCL